jgi:UDP-GlcNAc:undecaprenyl-phosphate GlcNAc-1-phosphate transferase
LVLILFDTTIESPFLLLSLFLTIFYVVGAINAMNMQDGLDGLAAGMALLSALGFAVLSIQMGQSFKFLIASILSGILIGFLVYNFNPAFIFMGDSGSYFLGFVLAYLSVSFTSLQHWSTFLAPVLIVGAPVLDTAFAILRRLKKGVSPFSGDRSHFYDLLVSRGFSIRQTVLICWGIQAFLVIIGVVLYK